MHLSQKKNFSNIKKNILFLKGEMFLFLQLELLEEQ